jgi:hypothetical protein
MRGMAVRPSSEGVETGSGLTRPTPTAPVHRSGTGFGVDGPLGANGPSMLPVTAPG